MKICFLCDLHLPFDARALQYDVLEWAVENIAQSGSDCIAFAGDATCDGKETSYDLFLKAVGRLNVPFLYYSGKFRSAKRGDTGCDQG